MQKKKIFDRRSNTMSNMTGKERIKNALSHKESDRVPLDFGGMVACGIHIEAYKNLLNYLGIQFDKLDCILTHQTVNVQEEIYKKLGVDVRPLHLGGPSGFKSIVHEESDHHWFFDEWGRKWKKPKSSYNYCMVEFPMEKISLEEYKWPDPRDLSRFKGLEQEIDYYEKNTDAAIVFPRLLGNGFLQMGAQLYGLQRWMLMLAMETQKAEFFLDSFLEHKLEFCDALLSKVGNKILVIGDSDDLGIQNSQWISLDMFRKLIKPRLMKVNTFIKSKTNAKIFLHSCGSIYNFIPDLIEAGVDIINFQVSAFKMDTRVLKKEFGKDLVFWGGGIDTQRTLPFGKKHEIEDEVKRRIDDLAPGGGFVFAAVHNIQPEVPPESIVCMLDAFQKYSKY